jgi:hypothetical protein
VTPYTLDRINGRFFDTATADNVKDQHVVILDSINNDILACWETAQPGPQVLVAPASNMRMGRKKKKPVGNGIHHAVGNLTSFRSLAM